MTRRDPAQALRRGDLACGFIAAMLAMLVAAPSRAAICKYVDAEGTIHYTNVAPSKGWRKLSCDIVDEGPRRASNGNGKPSATPSSFPRVDSETQKSRDEMRRKVLNDELASEAKLLGEAREAYGNGAPMPLADEKSDAERYRQRIARLREAVQVHERNIEALRKELATIR